MFLLLQIVEDKKGVSTALCTHVSKSTVEYYRRSGSHVFCCFIDFKKAFDRVDYWLLFAKLIDSNKTQLLVCWHIGSILAYWFT